MAFSFDVMPLPENQVAALSTSKPKVYVMYNNSDYPETDYLNAVRQPDKIKVGFEIHSRNRRGANGIFAIQKKIFEIILGYEPKTCDKFLAVSFSPLEGSGPNEWIYYIQFSTESTIAEVERLTLTEDIFYTDSDGTYSKLTIENANLNEVSFEINS